MSASLRYVVLRHEQIDEPHFDLMFETSPGSLLATWRSDEWPLTSRSHLEPLGDHRRAYLDYEGPVSGNRGGVRRVAAGMHVVRDDHPTHLTLELEDGTALKLPRASA